MFTMKMSLLLNFVKLSLKGSAANFVMISHRGYEQLIPLYNNLKMMSLDQAKMIYCTMCTQSLAWFPISPILSGKGQLIFNRL